MADLATLSTPEKIAAAGERIYAERREALERSSAGQWAAVDVVGEQISTAPTGHEAIEAGRRAAPTGVFHLIRIGDDSAYRHTRHQPGPRD